MADYSRLITRGQNYLSAPRGKASNHRNTRTAQPERREEGSGIGVVLEVKAASEPNVCIIYLLGRSAEAVRRMQSSQARRPLKPVMELSAGRPLAACWASPLFFLFFSALCLKRRFPSRALPQKCQSRVTAH